MEFTDFVKRYFFYVEKLMLTIKFLCDTLNFCNEIIKKLCMFKNVTIKGELLNSDSTLRLMVRFARLKKFRMENLTSK